MKVVTSDGQGFGRPAAEGTARDDGRGADEKLAEAKKELFNLRFQSATGQLESSARLRSVRTDIARIYTEMRERELNIGRDEKVG